MREYLGQWKVRIHGLLKWSEKYTKTDMVYLAKGGFWFSFGHVISVGLTFISAVIFANKVSPDIYGTYKYALSMFGIFAVTGLTGMGNMVAQAVARGLDGSLFPAMRAKMRWSALGAVASLCFALYYFLHGNLPLAIVFVIGALFLPFMDPVNIFQDYLQGKKRFDLSISYFSISQLAATAVILIAAVFTDNLIAIVLAYLAGWTFMRLYFLRRTVRRLPPNDSSDPQTLSYGKHMSYIDIISTVIGSLDQALIFHFLGPISLAIYSFAIAPVNQLTAIFKIIPNVAMPKQAARPVKEIHAMLNKRIALAFLFSLVMLVIYFFVVPYFFMIFFPKYLNAIPYSRLFALTILITIPNVVLEPAISSKITSLSKKTLYLSNVAGALSLLFVLVSISTLGINGVIYSRLIYMIVAVAIGYGMWLHIVRTDKKLNKQE